MHAVILFFMICSTGPHADCEMGDVRARNCMIAERYIRDGLRPGQDLTVLRCEAVS